MSERSKGDVSSPSRGINNNAMRVVKNSLLSASVTGMSYDDYPNKPQLLPAAPPVVHAPAPQPTPQLIAGILNREHPKSLVTVGQPSTIEDTESFDEINLNSSNEDSQQRSTNSSLFGVAGDANANPLLEPLSTTSNDSLLSQAASSFTALPSVASNVFSTFSKRIYSGSSSRERTPQSEERDEPQLDIQPTYIQQSSTYAAPPPAPFYAAPPAAAEAAPLEPPKFYAPTEVPSVGAAAPPPAASGQNTYRLTARKKLYAPIPGFSEQQQQPQQPPEQSPAQFQTPPYPPQPAPQEPPAVQRFRALPEEQPKSSSGGLFSLTSLVPSGVLQNISGLVHSATGSRGSNEPSYTAPDPTAGSYFDITTASSNAAAPPIATATAPAFYPAATTATFFAPPPAAAIPAVGAYFVPTAEPTEAPPPPAAAAAAPAVDYFVPPAQAQAQPASQPAPPQPTFFAATEPPAAPLTAAAAPPPPPAAGQATYRLQKGTRLYKNPLTSQETAPAYFNPPTLAPTATPLAIFNPFGEATQTAAAQEPLPEVSQSVPFFSPPASTAIPSSVPLFAPPPAEPLPVPHLPDVSQSVPLFAPPTSAATSVPLFAPPSTLAPSTETLPATVPQSHFPEVSQSVPLFAPPPSIPASVSLFAPSTETLPTSVPLFAPPPALAPSTETLPAIAPQSYFPEVSQSVPLVAPPTSSAIPTSVPLFAPPSTQAPPTESLPASAPQSHFLEASQSVPLFAPPTSAAIPTSVPLFAPSTETLPTSVPLFAPPPTQASPLDTLSGTVPQSHFPEVSQSVPLFAPPPSAAIPTSVPLFAPPPPLTQPTEALPGTVPQSHFPEVSQSIPLFAPPTSAATSVSLFAPPPTLAPPTETLLSSVPLFAPPPTRQELQTEANQSVPLFVPQESASPAPSAPPTLFTPQHQATEEQRIEAPPSIPLHPAAVAEPSQNQVSFFAADQPLTLPTSAAEPPAEIPFAAAPITTEVQNAATALPASAGFSDFFGRTQATEASQAPASLSAFEPVALTTQTTTTTFFNPFAQAITTPLPQPPPAAEQRQQLSQDLLPPPIGFVAPATTAEDPFAAHIIEPPSLSSETDARVKPAASPLSNFFTAAAPSADFNFFGGAPQANQLFPELPQQFGIAPPPLAEEPPQGLQPVERIGEGFAAPPPLGFDLLSTPTQQAFSSSEIPYQNSSSNSFVGYFGAKEAPEQQPPLRLANSATFFDNFEPQQGAPRIPAVVQSNANEDQRIQNFFNNPPLQEQNAGPGDLKYDIVHSGLAVKNLEARSQTPISNLVEPPSSSACSEFSELSGTPQRQAQPPPQSGLVSTPPEAAKAEGGLSGADLLQQHYADLPEEVLKELRMAATSEKGQAPTPPVNITYSPVVRHWFYKRSVGTKFVWTPFSHYDSALLETSLNNDDSTIIVAVEGGRYDVNVKERTKSPVYWEGKPIEVRRCSWFYKGVDSKYVPYAEATAQLLETEFKRAAETGEWHQKIILSGGEQVVFHGPTVIVHFHPQQSSESWGASAQSSMRPRVVKRDLDDFTIAQGESQRVDHLLFMVHGIGSACDLKMRTVEEVVDDFRNIAQQLVQSHYKNSTDMGLVGRVEVLPISWHGHLHSEELGIDEKLKSITLESIPRLRNFTNDTLLDVLFYTSPTYCQKIMNTVATSLNEVYLKYRARHPEFNGGVSLAGHSLGSLILFDLLCHQEQLKESEEENMENPDQLPHKDGYKQVQLPTAPNDILPKQVSYTMGLEGTGQPTINYTQLIFHPKKFFALGSPIGMFVTIRGIDKLGLDFRLPTCPGFYNIFHPFDPVAYRIEALVNPDMNGIRPVLIPHHKGRKRMHLELKETMSRVGADIKQRFMDTFKTTLDSVNFLAQVTKVKREAEETIEKEMQSPSASCKQIEYHEESSVASTSTHGRNRCDSDSTTGSDPEFIELDFPLGKLNDSKRVDYVLQEAPLEFINEYIFALSSHVCYWESEDTILFVMKEIYAGLGISTDSQVPQQTMTIERPSSRTNSLSQSMLPL